MADLRVAVVCTLDGPRFVAAGRTEAAVQRQLAEYVRRHAVESLWPSDARQVRLLLENGRPAAAIELYFSRVGGRWDREWLTSPISDVDAI